MDVTTLRIDNAERMANQLNDIEISPTNYMLAFLRQRGWQLPADSIVIPNVIADAKSFAEAAQVRGLLIGDYSESSDCLASFLQPPF